MTMRMASPKDLRAPKAACQSREVAMEVSSHLSAGYVGWGRKETRGQGGGSPIQGGVRELKVWPTEQAQDTRKPGECGQKQEDSPPPVGPGKYRLLRSGCIEVGLLVASHSGRDGCGSRCLVNRNGLQT